MTSPIVTRTTTCFSGWFAFPSRPSNFEHISINSLIFDPVIPTLPVPFRYEFLSMRPSFIFAPTCATCTHPPPSVSMSQYDWNAFVAGATPFGFSQYNPVVALACCASRALHDGTARILVLPSAAISQRSPPHCGGQSHVHVSRFWIPPCSHVKGRHLSSQLHRDMPP